MAPVNKTELSITRRKSRLTLIRIAEDMGAGTLEEGIIRLSKSDLPASDLAKHYRVSVLTMYSWFRAVGVNGRKIVKDSTGGRPAGYQKSESDLAAERARIERVGNRILSTNELFRDYMEREHGVTSKSNPVLYYKTLREMRKEGKVTPKRVRGKDRLTTR